MIIFKEKVYSIEEGHYTGPKDIEEIPSALGVIGKTALVGAGLGAGVNYGIDKISGVNSESPLLTGAKSGGKWGVISGIFLKLLLNHLHKPMTSVKYNEVDKIIRRQFGIIRISGITLNDSLDNREKLSESFSFNDRDILKYKINISICDNSITLYTFGLTDQELIKTSDHLDYYCKKYLGMEYTSKLINKKANSYSVSITFTNYDVIGSFIIELMKLLSCKINILNSKAVVEVKINNEVLDTQQSEDRTFSLKLLDKYDLVKIFIKSGSMTLDSSLRNLNDSVVRFILNLVTSSLDKLSGTERANVLGLPTKRKDFNNDYLESSLNRMRYVEGIHYSIGDKNPEISLYLSEGVLMICVDNRSKRLSKVVDLMNHNKASINNLGKVTMITYTMVSRRDLDNILLNLIKIFGKINIHTR